MAETAVTVNPLGIHRETDPVENDSADDNTSRRSPKQEELQTTSSNNHVSSATMMRPLHTHALPSTESTDHPSTSSDVRLISAATAATGSMPADNHSPAQSKRPLQNQNTTTVTGTIEAPSKRYKTANSQQQQQQQQQQEIIQQEAIQTSPPTNFVAAPFDSQKQMTTSTMASTIYPLGPSTVSLSPQQQQQPVTTFQLMPHQATGDIPNVNTDIPQASDNTLIPPSTMGLTVFGENDVLSGRGGGTNVHPGNRNFRDLINRYRRGYLNARKNDKPAISRSIVKCIRDSGGRFLRKCEKSNLWFEIGDDAAREKTSQALRQKAPEMKKLLLDPSSGSTPQQQQQGIFSQQMPYSMFPGMMPTMMNPMFANPALWMNTSSRANYNKNGGSTWVMPMMGASPQAVYGQASSPGFIPHVPPQQAGLPENSQSQTQVAPLPHVDGVDETRKSEA